MSQLLTLTWLKWKLLRNSLRSRKAVVNQVASILGVLVTLALALAVATGLGIAAYVLTKPGAMTEAFRRGATRDGSVPATAELVFFSIFSFLYLMWATVPLSLGSSKQFDAGRMLIYPISLAKLFAVDFLSEITTLASMFAIPAILATSLGAGLGTGKLGPSLLASIPAIIFGMALSKWLSTTIGSLVRRKRARGETILALVGAVAGLGGALIGQLGPILIKHADKFTSLRWTPPGVAAYLFRGNYDVFGYVLALAALSAYGASLLIATFWIARRSALGLGGTRRRKVIRDNVETTAHIGWELPLVSPQLSAVIEKELRYAMRNAQLRMMALMPLILIVVRLVNSRRLGSMSGGGSSHGAGDFLSYGSVLMASGGILYVFLLLAGLSCNLFAFEEGGMRTLILSPVDRRQILLGKNVAVTVIAALFSIALLTINAIVFRDFTPQTALFALLSFIIFASLIGVIGNWFSMSFPKRMEFGKRLNVSGLAGLLLIPMILVLGFLPLLSTFAGYYAKSLLVEYGVLAFFALLTVSFYLVMINFQGRALGRREIEILEAVKEPNE
ncbi:MAG TPA: hypothetical protein VLE19_06525 [Pyrinomonadaceae bacterium]|nr:hypothetical protein [Pyrinomonadaceae bacterium]